ncbi:uncharacterized protein LOC127078974 [Lathyrus oleraceus]|uniref:uncharacterized protein LOC127078974 n=1 Tax=Pisum sativum TaxID=3888 RepID=UPI0021D32F32|nr:uncharacterized protein LOC127078974 [Pisum sativum]
MPDRRDKAQGLAFRGNDELISSRNKGNFLELMNFLVNHNEDIYKVWKNCRGNLKLTSPDIPKDIVKVAATITTQVILDDLEDDLFVILIDEYRDISVKDKWLWLYIIALPLKSGLESLFSKYGLSLLRIRAKGYDGESDMQGEYNASCKRRDILRESQATKVKQALEHGEISSERDLNQEITIKKPREIRWSSHYGTLFSIVSLFSSMIDVLEMIEEDGINLYKKGETLMLMNYMPTFEFIFILHLMKIVLGITHDLSQALQRSDQDIVNAMNDIDIPDMDDTFQPTKKKSKRKMEKVSNLHNFQVGLFYEVIDRQLQELNNRFTEVNTKLLLCVACLSPRDSFSAFDKERLIRLAQFYPSEFSQVELLTLDCQLENYFLDVCSDSEFSELEGIGDLSIKLVEIKKHVYPLVCFLLKLSLILSVATVTTERTFSTMNIIKNRMRNHMGDDWLND